jgi:hypothetical protein
MMANRNFLNFPVCPGTGHMEQPLNGVYSFISAWIAIKIGAATSGE